QQRDELLEQPADVLRLLVGPADGDLVAPDDDLGVEGSLHELEQLVSLAEEGDHGLAAGDDDLDLRGGSRQVRLSGAEPPASWFVTEYTGRVPADERPRGHPGGHRICRPPRRWKCRCATVCPAADPTFVTSRHPASSTRSTLARSDAAAIISASM